MQQAMTFMFSNFTLTLFVAGLVAALVALLRQPRPWNRPAISEALLSWFILFSVGISFFYDFVMHVFFSEMAAAFIGWSPSPFQKEVGFAALGFAMVGFLAFRGGCGLRLAAIVGPSFFLWGAAIGHLVQIVTAHNYAPGNAGVIFYSDILIPVFGWVMLWQRYRAGSAAGAEPHSALIGSRRQ